MTEYERQLMLETSMAVTLILDRLQWHDIGQQYFEHIEPYLRAIKEAKTRLSESQRSFVSSEQTNDNSPR